MAAIHFTSNGNIFQTQFLLCLCRSALCFHAPDDGADHLRDASLSGRVPRVFSIHLRERLQVGCKRCGADPEELCFFTLMLLSKVIRIDTLTMAQWMRISTRKHDVQLE